MTDLKWGRRIASSKPAWTIYTKTLSQNIFVTDIFLKSSLILLCHSEDLRGCRVLYPSVSPLLSEITDSSVCLALGWHSALSCWVQLCSWWSLSISSRLETYHLSLFHGKIDSNILTYMGCMKVPELTKFFFWDTITWLVYYNLIKI